LKTNIEEVADAEKDRELPNGVMYNAKMRVK
jgi:hypothetical protein